MALFVQIDHFRKTDQKPTVKNHLFSISWFRSFNRTSFQQQLKRINRRFQGRSRNKLQSYILSTTTETARPHGADWRLTASIVHPFNNNWNTTFVVRLSAFSSASIVHPFNNNWNPSATSKIFSEIPLQSYILSTTTETPHDLNKTCNFSRFNRTSFQQQLKRIEVPEHSRPDELQSYILSTTTETFQGSRFFGCEKLQSYILSTTTETHSKKSV